MSTQTALAGNQIGPAFIVNSLDDRRDQTSEYCTTEDCTFREALEAAMSPGQFSSGSVKFDRALFSGLGPHVINLTTPLPRLGSVTVNGPGARVLTVQRSTAAGTPNFPIFDVGNGVSIYGLTLSNGKATGAPANGGAIVVYSTSGTVFLFDCVLSGNSASNGGAIYNRSPSFLAVRNCTFHANTASGFGGAIFNTGSAYIENCTISGNSAASKGGAVYNNASSSEARTDIFESTIEGNSGIAGTINNSGALATVRMGNTIIKAGPSGGTIVNSEGATVQSRGSNLSSDAAGGDSGTGPGGLLNQAGDRRNTDPKLDPAGLQDNGGLTPTIALLADSSAINAGFSQNAPARDQRQYVRVGNIDIGAYEFGGTIPVTLANISTRLRAETADNVLIGGFIVTGSQPKRLMARAIGPSLGIAGALADPQLELYDSGGTPIGSNDNWQDAPNRQEIIDTTIAPPNALESAMLRSVTPGAYTAVVSGVGGASGIGLVEVYDLDRTVGSKLANISTRGVVRTADNVMIGGFIILGPDSQSVIVRALGPSVPVAGKLEDPKLELFNENGASLASNNNWRDTQEVQIGATGIPPPNDLESAIVRFLAPGHYTAVVSGTNNTTGVGLVEVYALP
jgi:hypothetical protein